MRRKKAVKKRAKRGGPRITKNPKRTRLSARKKYAIARVQLSGVPASHLAKLFNVSQLLRTKCVDGITVNEKVLERYMETTVGIVTALNPIIGYEKATELAKEAYSSGKGILEVIREKKVLTEKQIADVMDPAAMTGQK